MEPMRLQLLWILCGWKFDILIYNNPHKNLIKPLSIQSCVCSKTPELSSSQGKAFQMNLPFNTLELSMGAECWVSEMLCKLLFHSVGESNMSLILILLHFSEITVSLTPNWHSLSDQTTTS